MLDQNRPPLDPMPEDRHQGPLSPSATEALLNPLPTKTLANPYRIQHNPPLRGTRGTDLPLAQARDPNPNKLPQ